LLTIELILLLRASEKNAGRLLLWMAPLFALWANLHVQFVYGLGLILLFAVAASLPQRWREHDGIQIQPSRLWMCLGLSLSATLVNPYGWHVYQVVAELAFDKAGLSGISEMRPFAVEGVIDWLVLSLLCVAVASIATSQRWSALSCLLLLGGCWFGFHKQRDVWFLVILSIVVSARALQIRSRVNRLSWPNLAAAIVISGGLFAGQLRWGSFSSESLGRETEKVFPVRASEFIDTHNLPDPLFNPFDWGGYLIWRLPKRLVSIDGRSNLYGNDGVAAFLATRDGARNWKTNPALQQANTILIQPESALASLLRFDSGYQLVYEDVIAVVFVRRTNSLSR